jgi:integrase-like protein
MTDQAMNPLRRRMIEDMTIRKFAPKTQHDYLQRVKNFAAFLGRSPDTASVEDVRSYQLHLTARGVGVPTLEHVSDQATTVGCGRARLAQQKTENSITADCLRAEADQRPKVGRKASAAAHFSRR